MDEHIEVPEVPPETVVIVPPEDPHRGEHEALNEHLRTMHETHLANHAAVMARLDAIEAHTKPVTEPVEEVGSDVVEIVPEAETTVEEHETPKERTRKHGRYR